MDFTFKTIDSWLGQQALRPRLKWNVIYLSDSITEIFNVAQLAVFGRRNQVVSRILAGLGFLAVTVLPWVLLAF